ncbi:MAG: IS256 family transposase, partial [Hyphomicrobiales bacterium]|nr:IS256 family transposase [Hyphomicrobiales bacterium]
MEKNNVVEFSGREGISDPLTDLLQSGARQVTMQAVEVEVEELLSQYSTQRTEGGKAGVARNGYLPKRQLQTGIGPVTVKVPKVRSRTGKPVTFSSALVPPYVRKTKSLEAALD